MSKNNVSLDLNNELTKTAEMLLEKHAKEYNNGEWFWVQYIGHLYGAIALDFDSPNGWLCL